MIDYRFHNGADEFKKISYEANKAFYDPDKPRIKDILWKHYDWIENTYNPLEGVRNDRQYRKNCIDEMRKMSLSRGSPGVYA